MPDDATPIAPQPFDWKASLFKWAAQQGFAAVLLLVMIAGLAYGGYYGLPAVVKQIQDGSQHHADTLKEGLDSVREGVKEQAKAFDAASERDHKTIEKLLDSRK